MAAAGYCCSAVVGCSGPGTVVGCSGTVVVGCSGKVVGCFGPGIIFSLMACDLSKWLPANMGLGQVGP